MPQRVPSAKIVLALLLPCMLVLGIVLGGHPRWLPDPVADALVGNEDTRQVAEAFDQIQDNYYRKISGDQLANTAIKGAVAGLNDRFSNYFTPKEYKAFEDQTNSRFSGVGLAVIGVDDGLQIETIYDDSPAERGGLRVGDVIIAVNGRSIAGRTEDEGTTKIKGPPGTEVTLRLRRGKQVITRKLTRATISVPVVASDPRRADGEPVAQIQLATFSSGAHGEVVLALRRAIKRGAKGIIFDLRGNGGGLVREAQLIASAFLDGGPIVTTKGRSVPKRTLDAVGKPTVPDLPTVVLVDGGTASASEIVAGALQDRKRAKVVGRATFGKGVFQEVIRLDNGGALDITAGQYFTPNGRNLGGGGVKQGKGIIPDVKAIDDPKTKRDEALDKALDVLGQQL